MTLSFLNFVYLGLACLKKDFYFFWFCKFWFLGYFWEYLLSSMNYQVRLCFVAWCFEALPNWIFGAEFFYQWLFFFFFPFRFYNLILIIFLYFCWRIAGLTIIVCRVPFLSLWLISLLSKFCKLIWFLDIWYTFQKYCNCYYVIVSLFWQKTCRDLSNNNLSGEVPSTGSFSLFTPIRCVLVLIKL